MRCPFCRADDTRVIDSRELSGGDSIRRRRECSVCGRRFTTYERVEGANLMVVKKDGRRQDFDPVKLRQKLRVALTKRPVGEDAIDAILTRVEADLLARGTAEVPSSAIGGECAARAESPRRGCLHPLRLGLPPVPGYRRPAARGRGAAHATWG